MAKLKRTITHFTARFVSQYDLKLIHFLIIFGIKKKTLENLYFKFYMQNRRVLDTSYKHNEIRKYGSTDCG